MRRASLLAIIIFILGTSTIHASNVFKNDNNRKYFGVRFNYSTVSPDLYLSEKGTEIEKHYELFNKGFGVGVSGIFHLPIVANLYFEPGLDLNIDKFNIKKEALIGENKELIQTGGLLKQHSVLYTSLEIPLMIGYHLDLFKDFNLALFMGPAANIGLSMDARIKIEKDGKTYKTSASLFKPYQSPDDDYLERLEWRWIMGASMNYKQYMIGFKYDIAATGLLKTSDYNSQFYSGNFDLTKLIFSIGYNFK